MKKIEQFQITSLMLSGFKSYEEPTELVFGNPTVITGGNGRGKSSIADAIAFAVTGCPFFGERGIDRLHNENNPDVAIRMCFVDETGTLHELNRTRRKNRMTITYDGYEIRQLDLADLFGERDVFLSILNPLYFIEELGEDGKKLLERYLPTIPHETVLSQLSEPVREHLKNETILSPEGSLNRCREEIRKHDLIASNPMDNVERPKSQRYVGAFYSVSELETLFQAVKGDPCEFPVLMAAFYGLRRSEIMGLRWRAIDFENNLITIDHTVVQCMCDGTTITVEKDRTKNQSSCRSMPLVPQYRDLLLRMKVRQECCRKLCGNCYTESEYIFVNDMGEPYQPNYVTQHFKLVLRKNHLRSIRFHDLRHTCASLLLKNGVPMKDIQEWLGHSSYNTTANIYAHLDTSSKNTSASKMSNVVIIEPGISTSV